MATFCPLNSRRIKRSRASERSDQAIKDDFHRSKFLIPVANASTGDVYVTTPCSSPTTCGVSGAPAWIPTKGVSGHWIVLVWSLDLLCTCPIGKDGLVNELTRPSFLSLPLSHFFNLVHTRGWSGKETRIVSCSSGLGEDQPS